MMRRDPGARILVLTTFDLDLAHRTRLFDA
jgi:hypothetical protein